MASSLVWQINIQLLGIIVKFTLIKKMLPSKIVLLGIASK
jgi:hypothetical protein